MRILTQMLLLIAAMILTQVAVAQDRSGLSSANISRAMEAADNGDYENYYNYLRQEISVNPNNGYAYSMW